MRNARILLRVVIFAAVIAGFAMPSSEAMAAPARPAVNAATMNAATMTAATMTAATMTAAAKPTLTSLQQQIKDQSAALEKIVEQYNQIGTQLAANQKAQATLEAQMAPTKAALDNAQGQLATLASVTYMGGTVNSLTALVASADASDLLNQLTTLNQVATEQQRQITGFQQAQTRYHAQERTLRDLIAVEGAQRKDLATQKATITAKLAVLYKARAQAFGSATVKPVRTHAAAPSVPGRGGKIVRFAYAQLGKPYAWAKAGPNSYDCSGLVLAAYRSVGISLPHNARMQWGVVHHIGRSQLQPGDLVFYSGLGHVALYIGGGEIIHAPTFGERVKISNVDMMKPYGYGRV